VAPFLIRVHEITYGSSPPLPIQNFRSKWLESVNSFGMRSGDHETRPRMYSPQFVPVTSHQAHFHCCHEPKVWPSLSLPNKAQTIGWLFLTQSGCNVLLAPRSGECDSVPIFLSPSLHASLPVRIISESSMALWPT
jgi:hypothetical protein